MKVSKRIAAAVLCAAMTASLAACDSVGKDPMLEDSQTYIQGKLDAMYLGKYNQEYLDLVDMTEEEAEEMYLDWLYQEVDLFCGAYGIEYQDDELDDEIADMFKDIYAKAKYTVHAATKLESGNYAVEVTVEPVEVLSLITEEEHRAVDDAAAESLGKTDDDLDAMSQSEYEEWYKAYDRAYAEGMIELVRSHMAELSYQDAKSFVFQLAEDTDGYYLVEGDLQNFDQYIIAY